MRNAYVLFGLALFGMLFFGCLMQTTKIRDILDDPDSFVGKEVKVKGVVEASVKIGQLSGFRVNDNTGMIGVRSDTLPPEGSVVTVVGTVADDTIFGHYILAKDVTWEK